MTPVGGGRTPEPPPPTGTHPPTTTTEAPVLNLITALRTERHERAVDKVRRLADNSAWLAFLNAADPVPHGLTARCARTVETVTAGPVGAVGLGSERVEVTGYHEDTYADDAQEPCSRCEDTDYDGLLDDWGLCQGCLDRQADDAADGYDRAED